MSIAELPTLQELGVGRTEAQYKALKEVLTKLPNDDQLDTAMAKALGEIFVQLLKYQILFAKANGRKRYYKEIAEGILKTAWQAECEQLQEDAKKDKAYIDQLHKDSQQMVTYIERTTGKSIHDLSFDLGDKQPPMDDPSQGYQG